MVVLYTQKSDLRWGDTRLNHKKRKDISKIFLFTNIEYMKKKTETKELYLIICINIQFIMKILKIMEYMAKQHEIHI